MNKDVLKMDFENLAVWKRSTSLSCNIYKELRNLKDFGFKDQITRSSLSIPSNIAEGFERLSDKETIQFLGYAKGSCGEVRTQIQIGIAIGYIPEDTGKLWLAESKELSKMIAGLIRTKQSWL